MAAAGPFDRWISFELGRLNAGLVVEKKSLTRLLAEPDPECRTREGDPHQFDRAALDRLAAVLTREEADDLRLPLTLVASGDSDSAYLTDELGAKALRAVEKVRSGVPVPRRTDGPPSFARDGSRATPRRRRSTGLRLRPILALRAVPCGMPRNPRGRRRRWTPSSRPLPSPSAPRRARRSVLSGTSSSGSATRARRRGSSLLVPSSGCRSPRACRTRPGLPAPGRCQ